MPSEESAHILDVEDKQEEKKTLRDKTEEVKQIRKEIVQKLRPLFQKAMEVGKEKKCDVPENLKNPMRQALYITKIIHNLEEQLNSFIGAATMFGSLPGMSELP